MESFKSLITEKIIKKLKEKGADKKIIEELEKELKAQETQEKETKEIEPYYQLSFPEFEKLFPPNYIKVEANLENLGFFTPSTKRSKKIFSKEKTQIKTIDGKKIETSAKIIGSYDYGLPITIDQDIFYAFMEILNGIFAIQGKLPQPIGFKSEQIIKLMGKKRRGGDIYKEIEDWLQRMTLTGIQSKSIIYLADKKVWATDTFHVFDRTVAFGKEMREGGIADKNYVWLSDWFRKNYEKMYFFYLDHEFHKRLRKPIAKALRPLLSVAFYASGGKPATKRYDELAKELNIHPYKSLSKIKEQLEPSHQEFKRERFIDHTMKENPIYEKTKDGLTYNITWYPGEKYFQDQAKESNLEKKTFLISIKSSEKTPPQQPPEKAQELVKYFHKNLNQPKHEPTQKEIEQATSLIKKYGYEKAKKIVDWVLRNAQITGFQMKLFGAVISRELDAIADIEENEAYLNYLEEKTRQHEEELKRIEKAQKEFEAKPLEEKVKIKLQRWLEIQRALKREPTPAEIEKKRQEYFREFLENN